MAQFLVTVKESYQVLYKIEAEDTDEARDMYRFNKMDEISRIFDKNEVVDVVEDAE